jgi:hypothetical protein
MDMSSIDVVDSLGNGLMVLYVYRTNFVPCMVCLGQCGLIGIYLVS